MQKENKIGPAPKTLLDYLTGSIIPKEWIDPITDAIDHPTLDRSPWEARLQGFGAGALEGARQQINPVNLAMLLAPTSNLIGRGAPLLGAGKKASRAVQGLSKALPEASPLDEMLQSARTLSKEAPEVEALSAKGYQVPNNPVAQALEAERLPLQEPTAKYLGRMGDEVGQGMDLYNIIGGPRHGSTVSLKTLRDLGIRILE